jgi:hypothetical protein
MQQHFDVRRWLFQPECVACQQSIAIVVTVRLG